MNEVTRLRAQVDALTAERDLLDKGHSSVLRAFGKLVNKQRVMTDKPKQGRPPKPVDQQTKPYSVRLTPERIAKLKLLKSAWLNKAIDRAKLKGDQ